MNRKYDAIVAGGGLGAEKPKPCDLNITRLDLELLIGIEPMTC